MKHFRTILLILLLLSLFPLFGDEAEETELSVSVVVFGPVSPVYVWWGHIGFIVRDPLTKTYSLYDYGNFQFDQENFYTNFAMGRLLYDSMKFPAQIYLDYVEREQKRDIRIHELNLSVEKRYELWAILEDQVKPENRVYLYHHFLDNCSTRIRDPIDTVLDGQIAAAYKKIEKGETYRSSFRKFTSPNFFMDWLLSLLQGPLIDEPISVWEEMYLPITLERELLAFSYVNEEGETVPLVKSSEVLKEVKTIRPVKVPPYRWLLTLLMGFAVGGVNLAYFYKREKGQKRKALRIASGSLYLILGFLTGIIGLLLTFLMFFSNHDITFGNLNIFIINPLSLMAIWVGFSILKDKKKKVHALYHNIFSLLFLAQIAAKFFVTQNNLETMAFLGPMFLLGSWPVMMLITKAAKK